MRLPDDKDAGADDKYADPAQGWHGFSQKEITQHGDHGVGKRGGRLNVALVRPSENEHVGDKETEQAGDPEPDVA